MEPNPQIKVTPTLRYAAVVVPNYNGGEKRLVKAAPKETCMTEGNQTKLPSINCPEVVFHITHKGTGVTARLKQV